jgi:hypothetical protein
VISGKMTITKEISADYPNNAASNAAQGFVFRIDYTPAGVSVPTETFYEVLNFSNGGALSMNRTIVGLKKGTYKITEESGLTWRYTLDGANGRTVGFGHDDMPHVYNGVVISKTVSTFVNNLTTSKWFGDAAYAINRFIGAVAH